MTMNNDIVVCCLVATSMTWHLFRCQKGIWGCAYPGWTWRDVPHCRRCLLLAWFLAAGYVALVRCSDGVSDMAVGEWRGNGTSPYHILSYNCGLGLEGLVHNTT
jgi:hypothetical protein